MSFGTHRVQLLGYKDTTVRIQLLGYSC